MRSPSLALVVALLPLAACADATRASGPALQVELESPAAAGSRAPRLSVGADGRVRLAWIEPLAEGGHALRFALLGERGWGPAREVARGEDWFVNWADVPALAALADGTLLAAWLDKLGPGTYAYGVRCSLSRDGGASWSAPGLLHEDRSESEHGFVSLVARDAGSFAAVWLDGRGTSSEASGHHGAMQLWSRTIARDGTLLAEHVLDERVCDCCPTALASVGGELLAAYRDRDDDEVRDVSLASIPGSARPLHADGWRIDGCPVNGPALAVDGERVGAVWYTEAAGQPRVLAAFSGDGGARFATPLPVSEADPLGCVSAAFDRAGRLWVSWLERGPDGEGAWRLQRVEPSGRVGPAQVLAAAPAGRAAGIARLAADGARLVFAWTEVAADGATRVRTASLEPSDA